MAVGGYGGYGTHKRRADVLVYDPLAPSNDRCVRAWWRTRVLYWETMDEGTHGRAGVHE